ncbi:chloride channel protein [Companilactobacillus farciminis]|uniref:chloride channel protein n=1 Tax=Companilactobacillus farciminis TaxID=1612 RepID=UPI0019153CDA|nr:chloride channel protein [Companilactobacillus farciminis]
MTKRLALFSYGLILSAVIGVIAALFLIIENLLSELVWTTNNQLLQILLVAVGGFILYFLLKKWPDLPKTAHDSIVELKTSQTIDYQDVFVNLLITLVILTFGAGVGPEAALLSAIISLSIWQADNLRYLYFHYDELKQLRFNERMKRLFNPFAFRQKYDREIAPKAIKIVRQKKLLYGIFTLNGVISFGLLLRQTDQPSFVTKLGQTNWSVKQIWIVPILMILGIVFARICKLVYRFFTERMSKISFSLPTKVAVGTLGIMCIVLLEPELLFSGQHSLHLLVSDWSQKTALFLIGMAILKLIFLAWCLNFNWRGGDIFPLTFAAMILGFATAQLLPSFDKLLIVAVVATTFLSEMVSPIIGGIFLIFFFPIQLWVVILLVAGLLYLGHKKISSI